MKPAEYVTIKIPADRIGYYRSALCAAWEEFDCQIQAGIGNPDADALYRSTRYLLDELCVAFDGAAKGRKALAEGTSE